MVKQLLQEIIEATIELNYRTFTRVSRLQLMCRKRDDPDENIDAEIDWILSGVAKIWSTPKVDKVSALKGHTERLTDVAFSPVQNHLATASADRTARLWNSDGSLLNTFEGHL